LENFPGQSHARRLMPVIRSSETASSADILRVPRNQRKTVVWWFPSCLASVLMSLSLMSITFDNYVSILEIVESCQFGYSREMMKWYERANQIMKEKGVSPSDLAQKIDESLSNVSRYLSGIRGQDSIQVATRFAVALEVSPLYLLYGQGDSPDDGQSPWWCKIRNRSRGGRLIDQGRHRHSLEGGFHEL